MEDPPWNMVRLSNNIDYVFIIVYIDLKNTTQISITFFWFNWFSLGCYTLRSSINFTKAKHFKFVTAKYHVVFFCPMVGFVQDKLWMLCCVDCINKWLPDSCIICKWTKVSISYFMVTVYHSNEEEKEAKCWSLGDPW